MWQVLGKIFSVDQKTFRKLHLYVLILIILAVLAVYYSRFWGGYRGFSLLWYITIFEYYVSAFGILFIIPLTYAAFFMNTQIVLMTWLVCGILMIPRITFFSFHVDTMVISYLIYTLPFLISLFIKTVVMWRQMERKAAAEKEEQRQKYLALVYNAHENERKNIARELHDSVIQSLVVMTNQAQAIISGKNHPAADPGNGQAPDSTAEQIVVLRDMSRDISKDIRNICLDLRPYLIDDMGLVPALRWLIDRTKTTVALTLTSHGKERRFDRETELMLYRIVQEAINNILRHSQALEASINIYFNPLDIKISIEDNGRGFVYTGKNLTLAQEGKLGLIGMQERVKLLNGQIKIASQPGQGTQITIEAGL
jgi:signal transduction histidine kinase